MNKKSIDFLMPIAKAMQASMVMGVILNASWYKALSKRKQKKFASIIIKAITDE